jgi:uncharacterized protein YuzB (UPF0349 family)
MGCEAEPLLVEKDVAVLHYACLRQCSWTSTDSAALRPFRFM